MKNTILYVCNNVRKEVEISLERSNISDVEVHFFPSYCGHPPLELKDLEKFKEIDDKEIQIAVGSVCMKEISKQQNKLSTVITEENCFYFFLNDKLVDHFISDGAYLLTPGWLKRWKEYLEIWKFDQNTARDFFKESCKYLLFLDTGVYEDIKKDLSEFEEYIQLEVKILPIGLEFFRLKLITTIEEQRNIVFLAESKKDNDLAKRKVSEYAMAFDMIGNLTNSTNEKEVIDNVLMIMNMLFAPGKLYFLSYKKDNSFIIYDQNGVENQNKDIYDKLSHFQGQYKWSSSGSGFYIKIKFQTELLGSLFIDDLAFPQYKDHYLNLGLFLSNTCGLAIKNARSFQIVQRQKKELAKSYMKIKESEKKFRLMYENAPLSYQSLNEHGEFLDVNNTWLITLGYTEEEVVGKEFSSFLHPDWQSHFEENFPKFKKNGFVHDVEFKIKHKDGHYLVISFEGCIGYNPDGTMQQTYCVFQDITEKKLAEEKIKSVQERIRITNSILRHDIGNDLGVISSAVRLFERSNDKKMLEEVKKRVTKCVDQIRRHRKLEAEIESQAELSVYDLFKVASEVTAKYTETIINISGSGRILADEAVYSIFDNLVSNAIKHAQTDKINIDISEYNEKCLVEIADFGVGIPDNLKNNVFKEGFVYGNSGNTGLGLFIVKNTIERYDGNITIEDNNPKGAIFKIELKAVEI